MSEPVVIVTARDLQEGQSRPPGVAQLERVAAANGWSVTGVKWSLARVWARRKMAGASGPGSMELRQVARETITVRIRSSAGEGAYLGWERDDGGSWGTTGGVLRSSTLGWVPVDVSGLRAYLERGAL